MLELLLRGRIWIKLKARRFSGRENKLLSFTLILLSLHRVGFVAQIV